MCQNKATIIIPARSYDFILERNIKEIRHLYPDIKIIIIIDNNEKVDLPNVEFIHPDKKLNMSEKRNLGAKISNTEYICLLDSDSYPNKGWLEIGIEFLGKNKEYGAITGPQLHWPDDTISQKITRLLRYSPGFSNQEWLKMTDTNAKEQDISEFLSSNVIINRKAYLDCGGMDENLYLTEDFEFSKRFSAHGNKIKFSPRIVVFHRECTPFIFLKKIFCYGYLISKMLRNQKDVWFKDYSFKYYLPLILTLGYILFVLASLILNVIFLKLICVALPIMVLFTLFLEAVCMTKKLDKQSIKAILLLFSCYIMFCIVWLVSITIGIAGIKKINIDSLHTQY